MVRFPRLRRLLEQLLHTHDTPKRTAAAFALGVFFGFSPVLGLHTVLGIALAFALNLNRVAVLLGVYSNLPWVIVPYYTLATWLGAAILGVDLPPSAAEGILEAVENGSWPEFRQAVAAFKPFLGAFVLGSTIGSVVLAACAYRIALALIVRHRQHGRKPQDTGM